MPPRRRLARHRLAARARRSGGARCAGVLLVEQAAHRHVDVLRVGDVAEARRRRPASSPRSAGGSASVDSRGSAAEVEPFEDVQRDQGGDALAVRRDLPDLVAAIAGADRLDPGARVGGQVVRASSSRRSRRRNRRCAGQIALVEVLGLARRDPLQRAGVVGQLPDLAAAGRAARPGERLAPGLELRARYSREDVAATRPAARRRSARRSSPARRSRWPARTASRTAAAEAGVQVGPGAGRARHGDRPPAARGMPGVAQAARTASAWSARPGRAAGAVQPVQLLAVPTSAKASEPIPFEVGSTTASVAGGGDRRVDGAAAALQHLSRPARPAAGSSRRRRAPPIIAHAARRVGQIVQVQLHRGGDSISG